jgi:hypothetical protein
VKVFLLFILEEGGEAIWTSSLYGNGTRHLATKYQPLSRNLLTLLTNRVRRDIRFDANINENEANFYSLRSGSADLTCETNKNGTKYSFPTEYFVYFA